MKIKNKNLLIYFSLFVFFQFSCEQITNNSTGYVFVEDIDVSENSNYAITWSWSPPPNNLCSNFACGVFVRAYDASNSPVSNEILVSPTNNGTYGQSSVGIDDSGNFVVAYEEYIYNSSNPNLSDKIYLQKFNNSGIPVGARVFLDYGINPEISMNSNGDFIISYVVHNSSNNKLFFKKFSINLNPIGVKTLVHSDTNFSSPIGAASTIKCNGEFAFFYQTPQGSYVKQYYSNNSQKGGQILVNIGRTFFSSHSIIYNSKGEICLAYGKPVGADPFARTYLIKRFNENGSLNGTENLWDNTIAQRPSIGANECGDYAIVYKKEGANPLITLRPYSIGNVPETEMSVNTTPLVKDRIDPLIDLSSFSSVSTWDDKVNNSINRNIFHRESFIPNIINNLANDTIKICRYPCTNGCFSRSVIGSPPIPGYSYSWTPSTYLDNSTIAQPTVSHPGSNVSNPNFTITYSVEYKPSNLSCCKKTKNVVVLFEEGCK